MINLEYTSDLQLFSNPKLHLQYFLPYCGVSFTTKAQPTLLSTRQALKQVPFRTFSAVIGLSASCMLNTCM